MNVLILVGLLFLADPGYDPSICRACTDDELACEDDCDAVVEIEIFICLSSLPPEPPGPVIRCLEAADEGYDECVDECGEEAARCLARNNCPILLGVWRGN